MRVVRMRLIPPRALVRGVLVPLGLGPAHGWTLSVAALLSERPPPQLSATELRSRIALLEDAARAYRAELESRTTLWMLCPTRSSK